MSKEYGINLGYIPLDKEQYKELKASFLEECSKKELFDAIDDKDFILKSLLDNITLHSILDNLDKREEENAFDWFISNISRLSSKDLQYVKEELVDYTNTFILPTDNLSDTIKAEFIIENWDKIKTENIKL